MLDIIFEHRGSGVMAKQFVDKIKSGYADFLVDYLSAFPILIGVSIGVYALLNMISSKLANLGVGGVFVYGALVIIF